MRFCTRVLAGDAVCDNLMTYVGLRTHLHNCAPMVVVAAIGCSIFFTVIVCVMYKTPKCPILSRIIVVYCILEYALPLACFYRRGFAFGA